MRLIDADKLLNKIDAYMCGSQDVMFVKELIKKQQAAFDVEKVVEQLDNLRKEYAIEACNMNTPPKYTCYYKGKMRGYEHSIDIVREGGIDE